ncbi:hypothetical protein A3I27_00960 [Candidatus Giovannonibacteria bacterium RIFCSPLOWO2_02_FULL_43_11b]|uniref:EamA domain-containing protein n=1 Tax=Candidatus Giovannonibacteria bacterium RIFCSPHIGHO2_12_FULL_43_15 TaxID=1798341 RepID=A0A1F5WPE2_9BACT|nr:MAG: hypothetical protein A2739_01165 [Candidatus Giovannonibacteria bacterium RIFCSPHIGHO2_01_FULL_43_100]OGF66776.1 MAG: hypothetical protein A3B97_02585 [Candidatus Giovannonibacteria bacterium RIFCSPHIGHO2_02_FULL_43_32]OGF77552.1 MAG: hypothetical protein A3F23_01080 [Candidatus Giovannonibacteria bacterium RIFCSPHIGHO2_12_FULL_43_15]OGF79013.1 MAG: hypothetical protein A3A15_00705 [Candidatus Giovannonibacteria bacterium RIFCSPLOWO2_01_FULL_43_60]OGF90373.1 MAG: hypothetical protein A3
MLKNPLVLAFIASLFFGICPILFKLAISSGPAPDVVIWVGAGVTIGGCVWKFFEGGSLSYSWSLIWNSTFSGIIYTAGLVCALLALKSEGGYLSLIVPIYNINTIWTMLAGLIYFNEYQKVSISHAVIGAVLIIIGGGFIGLAKK